jgi:hypothetical protein
VTLTRALEIAGNYWLAGAELAATAGQTRQNCFAVSFKKMWADESYDPSIAKKGAFSPRDAAFPRNMDDPRYRCCPRRWRVSWAGTSSNTKVA